MVRGQAAMACARRIRSVVACVASFMLLPAAAKSGFCHMFYVNADTNLEAYQVGDMQEVLSVDPSKFTGLLYMDRNGADTSSSGSAMDNLYDKDGRLTTEEISTVVYAKMGPKPSAASHSAWFIQVEKGELDTTWIPTFVDFVKWAWDQCSDDQYHVVSFNMHGGGVGGISGDDSNGHSSLSIPELQQAFQILHNEDMRFDIIGFDTCLMSAYSVGQVLWPLADYLVASLPTEPGYGWAYDLINTQAPNALEYAKSIVAGFLSQQYGPNQLVLTDLAKFGQVVQPMKALMSRMTNGIRAGDQVLSHAIEKAREDSAEYPAVWETFVDWYDIKDHTGAQEKSQMDLGNFLRHLRAQCPALRPEIDGVLPKLEQSMVYQKVGEALTQCTGPGCSVGAEGIALWFKKRRWMHAAYQHYADVKRGTRRRVDRAIRGFALETEVQGGLPDWYTFLKYYYTFAANASAPSTCAGTTAGGSGTSGDAHNSGRRRRRSSYNNVPQHPQCPSDGQKCSLSASCTCPPNSVQQMYGAVSGGVCYGCEVSTEPAPAAPSTCHEGCCPGPDEDTCTWNPDCQCSSGQHTAQFSCGYACFCFGCEYDRPRLGNATDTDGEHFEGDMPRIMKVHGLDSMENAVRMWVGKAPPEVLRLLVYDEEAQVRDIAKALSFPDPRYACSDDQPLCSVETTQQPNSGFSTSGSFASWVTAVDQYIGTDRTAGDVGDVAWTLQLPTAFIDQTRFTSRWPMVLPYIVTAGDECQAMTRVSGAVDVFADAELCKGHNVTLSAPVRYYKTQSEFSAGKYKLGKLQQEVTCDGFAPLQEMLLVLAADNDTIVPTYHVPKADGGLVQPMIVYGKEPSWTDATLQKCASTGPMAWNTEISFEMVEVGGPRVRQNVHSVYCQVVTNRRGDGLDVLPSPSATRIGRYTFKVDAKTGEYAGIVDDVPAGNPGYDDSRLPWLWILLALGVLLICCVGVALWYALTRKKSGSNKRKSRGRAKKTSPPPLPPVSLAPQMQLNAAPLSLPQPMGQYQPAVPVQHVVPVQTSIQPMAQYTIVQ
eukprot:CAMPEP_0117460814 /NCGR_PEP_ID=MMETSP0784-20121206/2201_1 /TAXON_ID=39447 /ORGANISM="" /LENGTH=1046 /DNA_ID=CAMNT_0005254497 /DNA_START=1 /DNA_END=3142 /DNA_ORIENTATION=-